MASHECPGCGQPGIARSVFACRRCWYRLPTRIRNGINEGWRHDSGLHVDMMTQAMDWYAEHPLPGVSRG
jgi:hypothetical protein